MGSEPRDDRFHTEGMLKVKPCLHGRIMSGILNGIGKTHSVHTDRSEHYITSHPVWGFLEDRLMTDPRNTLLQFGSETFPNGPELKV